jgi:hypothetical protein
MECDCTQGPAARPRCTRGRCSARQQGREIKCARYSVTPNDLL